MASVDFFTVPTVTFRVLFVFVVLAHYRRRVVPFNVTDSPTVKWTAQQIVEAIPWDSAPQYLIRDRDGIYRAEFSDRVQFLVIREVKTAPRSSWQNPYAERLIGTLLVNDNWISPPPRGLIVAGGATSRLHRSCGCAQRKSPAPAPSAVPRFFID